ncbi:hypothetical protein ZHAS_00021296 [Anopheles sinensis]|uniref:Uncharacterized protein n=1 Tax=Anopheles sinensis TaxID=74873 RepID=A0A084WS09_ANOSI|nr:hypothetical protein ZHAS_00021296 [Anopheles sinensis]
MLHSNTSKPLLKVAEVRPSLASMQSGAASSMQFMRRTLATADCKKLLLLFTSGQETQSPLCFDGDLVVLTLYTATALGRMCTIPPFPLVA